MFVVSEHSYPPALSFFMYNSMDTIFTLEKLYSAYRECQRGKKNTINALTFEYDREKNLMTLLHDLQSRKYEISRHIYFIVKDPTPREIFAADFRDRIVHHLLCREIQSLFEEDFCAHSYANRKGKGTHKAVVQLRKNMQCVKKLHPNGMYYLKLDIENFFRSIDQRILFQIIEKNICSAKNNDTCTENQYRIKWQTEIMWLVQKIIFHNPTSNYIYRGDVKNKMLIPSHKSLFQGEIGTGLPIGNLTSQFFANVYLNQLDQFITKTLGINTYVRYVDDFVLVGADKLQLRKCKEHIQLFLQDQLRLRLHPRKVQLQESSKGIDFLGYVLRPNYTLVRQRIVRRLKNKLYQHNHTIKNSDTVQYENDSNVRKIQQTVSSYYGHFSHAQSFRLRNKIDQVLEKLM